MTITLRPLHLAILAAFIAGLVVAGVVIASGGSDDPQDGSAPGDTTVTIP